MTPARPKVLAKRPKSAAGRPKMRPQNLPTGPNGGAIPGLGNRCAQGLLWNSLPRGGSFSPRAVTRPGRATSSGPSNGTSPCTCSNSPFPPSPVAAEQRYRLTALGRRVLDALLRTKGDERCRTTLGRARRPRARGVVALQNHSGYGPSRDRRWALTVRARDFRSLRDWGGSQHRAFEELCCQLRDPTPDGADLVKTGNPDAGLRVVRDPAQWGHNGGGRPSTTFDIDSALRFDGAVASRP